MVRVDIYYKKGFWKGFKVEGHANNYNNNQYDLVCCAISMLVQTVGYTLIDYSNAEKIEQRDGFFKIEILDYDDDILKGIEKVFLNGIELMKKNYEKDIHVERKELA